jgi:Uma2 family endonuclease
MAARASTPLITAGELGRMPKDSMRRELVRGELRVMSPAGARHGRLAAKIAGMLGEHESKTGVGVVFGAETGFVLAHDPDTVRAPDAACVSKERFAAIGDIEQFWPGAPDLAVEVVSPGDSFRGVQEKALEWVAGGCLAVLVIDPANATATVYRPGGQAHVHAEGEVVDLGDAVPGFAVAVAELVR